MSGTGFVVMGVNAADAAKQRENLQASTDKLDLLCIAKMMLAKHGSIAGGRIGKERALRSLTRHRDSQVRLCTATRNRIHKIGKGSRPPKSSFGIWLLKINLKEGFLSEKLIVISEQKKM